MRIFISWSGNRSKAVAEVLSDWVKCVIQASRPWISTRDIDRGALWFSEISDQLKDTSVGVVCLTQENKNRPWILFESGALAKGLSSSRVCTLLVDLQPADLEDPLAQFNHTLPEKASMWGLVKTLNSCATVNALDDNILEQAFKTYWPQFESKFNAVLKEHQLSEKPEQRSEKNMLAEILETTRFLQSRVRHIEESSQSDSVLSNSRFRLRRSMIGIDETRALIHELAKNGIPAEDMGWRLSAVGVPSAVTAILLADLIVPNAENQNADSK